MPLEPNYLRVPPGHHKHGDRGVAANTTPAAGRCISSATDGTTTPMFHVIAKDTRATDMKNAAKTGGEKAGPP